jgi:hypothetical protein
VLTSALDPRRSLPVRYIEYILAPVSVEYLLGEGCSVGSKVRWSGVSLRAFVGLLLGAALVYLDNFAFDGETSPVVIVGCLLVMTACVTALWGTRAWIAGLVVWMPLPSAHLVKHGLGLPDTIQPNTYTSIAYLAAFTLVIAVVGGGFGLLVRRGMKSHVVPAA